MIGRDENEIIHRLIGEYEMGWIMGLVILGVLLIVGFIDITAVAFCIAGSYHAD